MCSHLMVRSIIIESCETQREGYGVRFCSQSDSEMLLMAFQQLGGRLRSPHPRYVRLRSVPFLDQRVAEIAYRIRRGQLLSRDNEKQILRNIARHHPLLPDQTIKRRKFGASIAASWMGEFCVPPFRPRKNTRRGKLDHSTRSIPGANQFLRNRCGCAFPRAVSIFRNLAWRLLILELSSKSYGVSRNAG
jgi:Asparagine synthase